MFDFDGIHEIWQTITRNKTRSLLTAFGVFWGIFLLVVLSSTGNGFENGLMQQVEGVTPNTAFFFTDETSEPYKGYQKGLRRYLPHALCSGGDWLLSGGYLLSRGNLPLFAH